MLTMSTMIFIRIIFFVIANIIGFQCLKSTSANNEKKRFFSSIIAFKLSNLSVDIVVTWTFLSSKKPELSSRSLTQTGHQEPLKKIKRCYPPFSFRYDSKEYSSPFTDGSVKFGTGSFKAYSDKRFPPLNRNNRLIM